MTPDEKAEDDKNLAKLRKTMDDAWERLDRPATVAACEAIERYLAKPFRPKH
jgi:hypothetical protein